MQEVLQVIQVAVLGPSLVFIGFQVLLQRRQVRDQVEITGFKLYHVLVQQYMDLLARADTDPELNRVWELPEPDRHAELERVHSTGTWAVWFAMTPTERRCYRYVRYALETFEQTHQLYSKGWIDEATWQKWQGWIEIWKNVRYFEYVLEDTRPRLLTTFTEMVDATPTAPRRGAGAAGAPPDGGEDAATAPAVGAA